MAISEELQRVCYLVVLDGWEGLELGAVCSSQERAEQLRDRLNIPPPRPWVRWGDWKVEQCPLDQLREYTMSPSLPKVELSDKLMSAVEATQWLPTSPKT